MPARSFSHRIIVVGGGAGGLELAVRLARAGERGVLLIDPDETHVWKPRLHELAAGFDNRLNENDYVTVAEARGFAFQQGTLTDVDPANRRITLRPFEDERRHLLIPERQLEYRALVLALGGATPDRGGEGVLDNTLMLDSQRDAREMFHRVSAGLLACALQGEGGCAFDVVIVGSGATGVELGAYLATNHVCKALAPHMRVPAVKVCILEAADTFMPDTDDSVRRQVVGRLNRAGVEMHAGKQVAGVSTHAVTAADGSKFPARLTVWAAGRVGPPLAGEIATLETNKKRQWVVAKTLQTSASPAVFAMGDCAFCEHEPMPPTAQVATEQARYLASAVPRFLAGE